MDTHKTVKNLGWPWSLHWCPACPCELTHILYSMCTCTIRLGSFHRLWQLMCLTFRAHLYIYIMLTIINHQACNILAQDAYIMSVRRYRGVWMFKWFFVPELRKWKEFELCIIGADEAWLSNEHLHFILIGGRCTFQTNDWWYFDWWYFYRWVFTLPGAICD